MIKITYFHHKPIYKSLIASSD